MTDTERYVFESKYPGFGKVDKGVSQLWVMPENVQEDILNKAMERFDATQGLSLMALGYTNLLATDLVRKRSEYSGSRLSDKDILTCLLMGNLDVFPLIGIHRRNLQPDGLDCSIWDGEFGPGYYFSQRGSSLFGFINPELRQDIQERLWSGPHKIPRVKELRQSQTNLNIDELDNETGCLLLRPNVAYLHGYWPAVRLSGLNVSLETRSNWGRLALAGAVNSITVHGGWNGVLTAETTTFTDIPMIIDTSRFPFQMIFDYVNTGLNHSNGSQFGSNPAVSLEKAAKEYQDNPLRMLPLPRKSTNIKKI